MRSDRPITLLLSVAVSTVILMAIGLYPVLVPAQAATHNGNDPIVYQGRLTDPDGKALDGTFAMRFRIFRVPNAGTHIWNSGALDVTVTEGLFAVELPVDQAHFDGRSLWLEITVADNVLAPRQPLRPAPLALGLQPGARILGDSLAANDAALGGYAPATGTALYGDAKGGVGLVGRSVSNYAVEGISTESWGGYFRSEEGHGIRVESAGADHYDHGAYVSATGGYGVYAQSATNQALRGEAGNVTGIAQPIGAVGVVGIGSNRGTYGSSSGGVGIYGVSSSNYGVWGQSASLRGVTGRTQRADNNYGFYTPDNLFSLNFQTPGALMQVMQYTGPEPLSPGDVVVFSGINHDVAGVDGPVVQVAKAGSAHSTAVAGVVHSRFNLDALDPDLGNPDGSSAASMAALEVTPAGDANPGEYVLVVVHGPAQVNVAALDGGDGILPGDLLSTSATAGRASMAATVTTNGVETAIPGIAFAKALEPHSGSDDKIYVYVTLQ